MADELRVAMLEDDSDDRYLTQEVLNNLGLNVKVAFYSKSNDMLLSLHTTKPDLILVDYNSTPENGVQLLKKLKTDETTRSIPVVVLSDSDHPKYREECYAEGASSVVMKPRSMDETTQKIKLFFSYWMEVAIH